MMLKQSSNKINPSLNMFHFSFKRNLGITVLLCIGFLLVCPIYMLTTWQGDDIGAYNYLSAWAYVFPFASAIVTSIITVGLNLLGFSYMYKRPSADLIDSMPLTRTELFFSKFFASYFTAIIPVFLANTGLAVTCIIKGYPSLAFSVAVLFVYEMISVLVVSAISMLFIVSSASVFDFLVSFSAVNLGLVIIAVLIISMLDDFLIGYEATADALILKIFSPIALVFMEFCEIAAKESLKGLSPMFFVYSFAFILVFGLTALLLFKFRKSESNGKAFAYKFMYYICSFIICYCSAYGIGSIFASGQVNEIIFYPFAVIGAIIIGIAYGAITFRGFKTVKSSAVISVASAVVLILSVVLVRLDPVGFNTHIPQKDEIKNVRVHIEGAEITFSDPDTVISMHKKIVDRRDSYAFERYTPGCTSVYLDYTLNNKKSLRRQYFVSEDVIKKERDEILKSDERFEQITENLQKSGDSVFSVGIESQKYEGNYLGGAYMTYGELTELIRIYREEITDGKHDVFSYQEGKTNISFEVKNTWYSFTADETYANTLSYIDSLNLEERVSNDYGEKCLVD